MLETQASHILLLMPQNITFLSPPLPTETPLETLFPLQKWADVITDVMGFGHHSFPPAVNYANDGESYQGGFFL